MLSNQRTPSGPLTELECIDMYFNELSAANGRRSVAMIDAQKAYERESATARMDYNNRVRTLRESGLPPVQALHPTVGKRLAAAQAEEANGIVGVDAGGHVVRADQEMGRPVLQPMATPIHDRMQGKTTK